MEFTLLAAAGVALAAAYGSLWLLHRRSAENTLVRLTYDMVAAGVLGGIVAGRLWAMIAAGTNPLAHPADLLIVRGGVDTSAATLGAIGAASWSARSALPSLLDAVAPAALFGLAGWHAGCLVRSACLGTPTSLPWGWPATPGGPDRHPVELYAAALLFAAGFAMVALWRRRPGTAIVATAALSAAAAIRGITEPLRPVLGGGLVAEYAVTAAVSGLALVVLLKWRSSTSHRPGTS